MYDISIKIRNYKCFQDEAGFDAIKRVNLIIGRNNSGKSSLLDVIDAVTRRDSEFAQATWRDGRTAPQIIYRSKIAESEILQTFSFGLPGDPITIDPMDYGKRYIGKEIVWSSRRESATEMSELIDCEETGFPPSLKDCGNYANTLLRAMPIPLAGKVFRKVLAERNIVPERSEGSNIAIEPNGNGITKAIQCFITMSTLPEELVEKKMLGALNEIFSHDAVFKSIVCQRHENELWEIYLEEEHKGRIALSKSGSGLKTVIAVLCVLFLVPKIEGKPLSDYIFGFEELENNIHPALLRRLSDYIHRSSKDNDFIYFLTTHSSVLIDQFSKQKDAQILHVTQHGAKSECSTARTYFENNGILDDLDMRASDLLQANGIIWVEGPSDRVYLNRWIHLWSGGALKEGTHFQIVFYGGRLLSHLSADSPDDVKNGISILNTNRNAIIIVDSDKRTEDVDINSTKERIKEEFQAMDSLCWITKGREIENYIPSEVADALVGTQGSQPVEPYSSFFNHIDGLKEGEGTTYSKKKVLLSEKLIGLMTKENLCSVLDLDEKMKDVCARIGDWNS